MVSSMTPRFVRNYSSHDEETFEEFTSRYEKEFDEAYDLFEVQRVLNNVFSYDLVPAPAVLEKALQAARRVNDYATASRVFEGEFYLQLVYKRPVFCLLHWGACFFFSCRPFTN